VIILENDEWFLLLQVELEIIMINDLVLLTLIFFMISSINVSFDSMLLL
jgi:hypothetical protein